MAQGYDKGREKFIYQARQSSLAGRNFGDGVLNARRIDSATVRRNRSASASSHYSHGDLINLRTGVRPARWGPVRRVKGCSHPANTP